MNCQQVRDHLSEYSDGLLTPEKTEQMREHLTTCEPCRVQCQRFETMLSALHTLPAIVPTSTFHATLQQRLEKLADKRTPSQWPQWMMFQYRFLVPAMVSLVLLISAGSYFAYHSFLLSGVEQPSVAQHPLDTESASTEQSTSGTTEYQDRFAQHFPELHGDANRAGTDYVLYTVSYDQSDVTIGF